MNVHGRVLRLSHLQELEERAADLAALLAQRTLPTAQATLPDTFDSVAADNASEVLKKGPNLIFVVNCFCWSNIFICAVQEEVPKAQGGDGVSHMLMTPLHGEEQERVFLSMQAGVRTKDKQVRRCCTHGVLPKRR